MFLLIFTIVETAKGLQDFNTSHVSINQSIVGFEIIEPEFQYISCFY